LQKLNVAQLQKKLEDQKIPLPENSKNPRHLIRALETNGAIAVKKGLRKNTQIFGLGYNKEQVRENILQRVNSMIRQGLEAEVKKLIRKFGREAPGLQTIGYREWFSYFDQKQNLERTIELIQQSSLQYAKRQYTWFKRNQHIVWLKNDSEAYKLTQKFLQQK
jgi:tRNA dimethylallyltransferase